MKKIAFMMCLALFTMGCESDDVEQFNPDDLDGDGVTNQQEAVDNTDPNNACSLVINSQYYPSVSNAWKALDCDGDGVTNWKELDPDGNNTVEDNGTNPLNDCYFIFEDQTLEPKPSWLIQDCDHDGVSNEQEVIDGTNVLDWCDFILANQVEVPTTGWQNADCDNDGYSNGRELEDNTDLFDPLDFDGAGSVLQRIDYGDRSLRFINNGTRYDKVVATANEFAVVDYDYDTQGNLISIYDTESNSSGFYSNINYTYNSNNQITQVLSTQQFEDEYSYSVAYDGNIIYTYDGTEPVGLYAKKITLNSDELITSIERFIPNGDTFVLEIETYEYDTAFENLLSVSNEANQGYDEITDEFFLLDSNSQYTHEIVYSYEQEGMPDGVLNPYYYADQDIRHNIILDFRINIYNIIPTGGLDIGTDFNKVNVGNMFFYHNSFSKKFMARFDYSFERGDGVTFSNSYRWVPTYLQENGLPISANAQSNTTYFFYYE